MPTQKHLLSVKYSLDLISNMEPVNAPSQGMYTHSGKSSNNRNTNPLIDEMCASNISVLERHEERAQKMTTSQWITVLILCFVNLINYMDRYTIAGTFLFVSFFTHRRNF